MKVLNFLFPLALTSMPLADYGNGNGFLPVDLNFQKNPVNPTHSINIDARVDSLLSLMTLEEKLGQLTLYTGDWGATDPAAIQVYRDDIRKGMFGAVFNPRGAAFTRELQRIAVEETRLKIPMIFGFDVIHGFRTIFPIPLGEAASWDLAAIEKSARVAATESAAAGLQWTFAPMVDLTRDPRWGRVMEGAGEDTYLACRIAEARVRGLQGKNLGSTDAIMACVKHFAAYGAPIAGREYNTVDMSERSFREYYLPPYAAAVKAGAATVMTAFNEYDGVPATGNKYLLTDVLRRELGFQGFVVTDYTSIPEMVLHGIVPDDKAAAELALAAGVDMDMQGFVFQRYLGRSLQEGKVQMAEIDEAVRRILRLKFQLGLFDDPYRFCDENREKAVLLCREHREAARDVARKSMVLLKNEKNALPLSRVAKIALIGPLADNKSEMNGNWFADGDSKDNVSLLEGLNAAHKGELVYSKGCEVEGEDRSGFASAVALAQKSDIVVVAIGELAYMCGEASSRTDIRLPGVQPELVAALAATGKPVIVVLFNGRPLAIPEVEQTATAILEAWWPGTEGGNAIADVLFGDYNPSGKLPMSFPRNTGQIPVFYNEKNTGRPSDPGNKCSSKYIDVPNSPLYPFGFGQSYTTFEYDKLAADKTSFQKGESLRFRVAVHNTGSMAGEETVQWYVRDWVGSVTRPVKELKGFEKQMIPAGATRVFSFEIKEEDLRFYRRDMSFGSEPGEFEVMVGGSSDNLQSIRIRLEN